MNAIPVRTVIVIAALLLAWRAAQVNLVLYDENGYPRSPAPGAQVPELAMLQADPDVVALRVANVDVDLARHELDAVDVELVGRRRVRANEVDERAPGRGEDGDRADEEEDRDEGKQAPARAGALLSPCERAGLHLSRQR